MDLIEHFPDGVVVGNYLVFAGDKDIFISRGFNVYPLPLEGLSDDLLIQYRHKLESFLTLVCRDGYDIQIQRRFDSDYTDELATYKSKDLGQNEFSTLIRNHIHDTYSRVAESGRLRREYMQLYVGKFVDNPSSLKSRENLKDFLSGLTGIYENFKTQLSLALDGATVEYMSPGDYYEAYFKCFNPSFANRFRKEVGQENFMPWTTLIDNVYCGDCIEMGNGNTGMIIDNYHYGFITINRWPKQSIPNITRALTTLPFNEARIVFNIYSVALEKEIDSLEKQAEKLRNRGNRMTAKEIQSAEVLEARARELITGTIQPVDVTALVVFWAETEEQLRIRTDIIKTAIRSMAGADYITENDTVSSRRILALSLPGWMGQISHRRLEIETMALADLAPISSAINGFLSDGQAFVDNDNGGIFGISLFQGGTPLHTFLTGASRAGKSVTLMDIISQVACFLGYLVIVESGNAWGTFTRVMRGQSIVVKTDGSMTFNYLDTNGVPFSPSHLDFCVSICLAMVKTSNEDLKVKRKGLLEKTIKKLYQDRFKSWQAENPNAYENLKRLFTAVKKYGAEKEGEFESLGELFLMWKELAERDEAEKNKRLREVTEQDIVDCIHQYPKDLEDFAPILYRKEDFPTHGRLVEIMSTAAGAKSNVERDEYYTMTDALRTWTKEGSYGSILDGVSNVDMSADIIQFELGEIPESAQDLKAMVGFILTNRIRAEVMKRSRAEKKVFVYEEASIILGIEGGAKLFLESLAQMGKYSCQVTIVTQQLAQFMDHKKVADVALANCRQFIVLRNSINDLNNLAKEIGMPRQLAHRASLFKPPADLSPKDRYASAVLFNPGSGISAILRVYASKELIWVADSEGDKYAQRMKQLKNVPDEELLTTVRKLSHE